MHNVFVCDDMLMFAISYFCIPVYMSNDSSINDFHDAHVNCYFKYHSFKLESLKHRP